MMEDKIKGEKSDLGSIEELELRSGVGWLWNGKEAGVTNRRREPPGGTRKVRAPEFRRPVAVTARARSASLSPSPISIDRLLVPSPQT